MYTMENFKITLHTLRIFTSDCLVLTEPSRGMSMKYLNLYRVPCESERVTVSAPLFPNSCDQASYRDKFHVMRGDTYVPWTAICGCVRCRSIMVLWSLCSSACPCTESTVAFVCLPYSIAAKMTAFFNGWVFDAASERTIVYSGLQARLTHGVCV